MSCYQRKSTSVKHVPRRIQAECFAFVFFVAFPPRYLPLLAPGSRSLSLACLRSLHLDFHAHPGMNAALKEMFTFR
jgi:hypothetical protein